MKELALDGISSRMGGEAILHGVSLSMDRGERVCLLGPSGCGKTSLLRIAAGLDVFESGTIRFRGHDIRQVPPHRRNFGMMFQDFALFPHRNVVENIAFGLEMKGKTPREIKRRVNEMLELVGLAAHGHRRISELSGGERQRVALARTLAPSPDLIMLDEPLGALDRLLRERLLFDLCTILDKADVTTLLVTHDQQEAFAVAHRICVMHQGRVAQTDTPERLYNHPANGVVADFLGFQNLVPGRYLAWEGACIVINRPGESPLRFSLPLAEKPRLEDNSLLFLPDGATIVAAGTSCERPALNRISGVLEERFFQGSMVRIRVKTFMNFCFSFDVPARGAVPRKGEGVDLLIDPESIRITATGGAV